MSKLLQKLHLQCVEAGNCEYAGSAQKKEGAKKKRKEEIPKRTVF